MADAVKQFIEVNIDAIDDELWAPLFIDAYDAFDNADYKQFCIELQKIGVDTRKHQEDALRFAMTYVLEEWLGCTFDQTISLLHLQRSFLTNRCGLDWPEFVKFCFDNKDEWDSIDIVNHNGQVLVMRKTQDQGGE